MVYDVVVGDIVLLTAGDPVPIDGLLVDGHSMEVATENPFLSSGSTMTEYSKMVVTCVGMDTQISYAIYSSMQKTPLHDRLENLKFSIRKVGFALAALLLVMQNRSFLKNAKEEGYLKLQGVIRIIYILASISDLAYGVGSVVVVVVLSSLGLAFRLTLWHSKKHLKANQVRV